MVFLLDHTILALGLFITTNYAVTTWKSDLAFSDKDLGDFLVGKCPLGKSRIPDFPLDPFFCSHSRYS